MRIKLFESFSEFNRDIKNMEDILVGLSDDSKINAKVESGNNYIEILFNTIGDDEDYLRDYEVDDFFKLVDVSEYIYTIIDYMNEVHNNISIIYFATDPAGDPVDIKELTQEIIEKVDSTFVFINNDGDQSSGLVFLSVKINFNDDN